MKFIRIECRDGEKLIHIIEISKIPKNVISAIIDMITKFLGDY